MRAIRFLDSCPDVTGLDRDEIRQQGRLYMERYYVGVGYERLHHIVESDNEFLHNHPWDFVSVLLTGGYAETTLGGHMEEYWAPCLLAREAKTFHRLTLLDGPMWTFVTTGPVINTWGFLTDEGFVNHREYLR